MDRIRAAVVICVFVVAVGSSTALVGDSPNASVGSRQTVVPSDFDQTRLVDVQILPHDPHVQRTQPAFFVVRIDEIPENETAVLLGFRSEHAPRASYDFDERVVHVVDLPPIFPKFDRLVYVSGVDSGEVVYVPVRLAPDESFVPDTISVSAHVFSKNFRPLGTGELELRVLCPVECKLYLGADEAATMFLRNLDLVIGILGLLIAFFGRKKIWVFLRAPTRHFGHSIADKRKRSDERPHDE